jgi:hypothetical protein
MIQTNRYLDDWRRSIVNFNLYYSIENGIHVIILLYVDNLLIGKDNE